MHLSINCGFFFFFQAPTLFSEFANSRVIISQALVARTTPLFSNFLFATLFSIQFLYFFIISSLFPYFNLFVTIFIQSYVNIKLHVSTLLVSMITRARCVRKKNKKILYNTTRGRTHLLPFF